MTYGVGTMPKIPPFKSLNFRETILDRFQQNIATVFGALSQVEPLNGRLIEDVALSTSETLVEHKLGRAYRGWIIVNKNAAQDVYVSSTTLNERFLKLTAAGTVTVSLWVF